MFVVASSGDPNPDVVRKLDPFQAHWSFGEDKEGMLPTGSEPEVEDLGDREFPTEVQVDRVQIVRDGARKVLLRDLHINEISDVGHGAHEDPLGFLTGRDLFEPLQVEMRGKGMAL